MVPDNLPEAPVRENFDRSSNEFLSEAATRKFVELIAGRTSQIRRYELTNYLRSLSSEFVLRRYFRSKVGISLEHNDIMTAGFDFSKLVNALIAASAIEEGGTPDPVLEKHLKACFKVNDTRIAVVHGRWSSTYGGDRTFHVSRNSMKQQKLFEYEGDLDELSDGIVKLRAEIAAAVHAGEERRPKPKKRKRKPHK
jgi:hypothetical protein